MNTFASIFQRPWVRALAVIIVAFAALFVHYGSLLQAPGSRLFSDTGDGLKNYYVFAYHVAHDSTLMQFDGMNHPFGEQIGYPDAQPALSGLMKVVVKVVPSFREHSVAVINLFCLLSMVLTALSIYFLLRYFKVDWIYAGVCGIALAALSPQSLRLPAAHHGLSYGWAIILVILFLLRTLSSDRAWRWGIGGSLVIFVGLFLHPYTAMIAVMWAGFMLFLLLGPLVKGRRWLQLGCAVGLLAVPILIFLLIQHVTDHHVGRALYPLGFFEYGTHWHGILAPPTWFRSPLSWHVFPWNMPQGFEASSYMGIGAMLGVLIMVPLLAIRWARNEPITEPHQEWPWTVTALVLAAVPLVAFAFGFPFSEEHGPYPWSLPFVGQFRSPGRFAWAGYYAFGIGTMFGAWWCVRNARSTARGFAMVFALLIPALYLYEGNAMHEKVSIAIGQARNVFASSGLDQEERNVLEKIDPERYRAIIPIPHFLAGSDELLLMPDENSLHWALVMSYWTGLPMTAYQLSRPSVTETKEQLGLLSSPWYERPISAKYAPDDLFLLLAAAPPANDEEAFYLELAQPVATVGRIRLASITAAELFKDRTDALFTKLEKLEGDSIVEGWISTQADARVQYFPWDDSDAEHTYSGTGAYTGLKRNVNDLAIVPAFSLTQGERYIASYWAYNKGHLRNHALTCVAERDPASSKEEWINCGDIRFARIVNGDWSMVEIPFTANKSDHEYRIFAEGKKSYRDSIWCDEVMVRPADARTFQVLERDGHRIVKVIYNGHIIQRP